MIIFQRTPSKNISVIIPCRNEEKNIPLIIPAILRRYKKYILEIIIVDDCSADSTELSVSKLKEKFPQVKYVKRIKNPGVGNALREGITHISKMSNWILFMDCDFIANVGDIETMIQKTKKCDGVVGSRFIEKKSLTDYPLPKRIANRSFHALIYVLMRYPHKDLTNNLKLYKKELVIQILPLLRSQDFAINAELGYFPFLYHAKIIETPVKWKERTKKMGLSKFRIFLVGPSYIRVLMRLVKYSLFDHFSGHSKTTTSP